MKQRNRNSNRLARVARGPFSYCVGPEQFTVTACGVTFCASTYRTMMRHGWVTEVL
jgi:hypothetical protein